MTKKMTAFEKYEDAEIRATNASRERDVERGRKERLQEEMDALYVRLHNERTRARTQWFITREHTATSNAAAKALKMAAVYQTAIDNIFKGLKLVLLVCPECGDVKMAGPKDDVTSSGYRLCPPCLRKTPDPWDKPIEYALAK
jgi:uncharacterized protein involved in type VI secretion and phage assembly